jgi:hypothetical protein
MNVIYEYRSLSRPVVRVVKFRRLRWAGLVPSIRETRNAYTILMENLLV